MDNNRLVVFDLDGTLNKTEIFSIPAHRRLLKELEIDGKTDADIIGFYGTVGSEYIRTFLPDADEETRRLYLKTVDRYEKELMQQLHDTYPGSPEALTELKRLGYRTAVCSNAYISYIDFTLRALGLRDQIDEIQPLIRGMHKEQTLRLLLKKLDPAAAVMVGDRRFDLEAARANQIPFIGCLYGYGASEMETADRVIRSGFELVAAVESLIGFDGRPSYGNKEVDSDAEKSANP